MFKSPAIDMEKYCFESWSLFGVNLILNEFEITLFLLPEVNKCKTF